MAPPLIELRGIGRAYSAGGSEVEILKDINLTIEAGEHLAIIGASGSGKSTLMNILGCLDRPTCGQHMLRGRDVSEFGPDDLAAERRERFGFIFQSYHLLADLSALSNTEIPAIYAGSPKTARLARATALLTRLGLGNHLTNQPGQLSGGQQQRVSIARALMNDPEIILADEPTGALDSRSGQEVLAILDELAAEGRTLIIVSHDTRIAEHARRVIEISDGRIIADWRRDGAASPALIDRHPAKAPFPLQAFASRFREAFSMALVALASHPLRTFLTMLGIVIGIASVVAVVALGQGSRQQVLDNISSLGTNTLEIYPGSRVGDMRSSRIRTLVASDAEALALQDYAAAVTPMVVAMATLRYGSEEANAQINGVGEQYFSAAGVTLLAGRVFDFASISAHEPVAVIDANTRNTLFIGVDPVGQVLMANQMPLRVIGVIQTSGWAPGGDRQSLAVFSPYTAVQTRLLGSTDLRSITLKVHDAADMAAAEEAATRLLTQRHGTQDFFIVNTQDIRAAITSTSETMTLLIAAVAVISLIVGGIGVMNIMLVSVTERVSEIGVRMAVGARRSDILQQFLIEAVLVCLIGGVCGIALAFGVGVVAPAWGLRFVFIYSMEAVVLAFLCSSLIGIVFGFLPARNASRMNPVKALTKG